ncbi:MAG: hypothetical protein BWY15_01778 [Firmicutes bacterium ADurb.Bin193]|nr:MAG: hypothetical protein BWY15_01778 [Firmicutes bacterium ADurb.Bin193]
MDNKENKQLCPKCQTGKNSYILDPKSAFCPHIACLNKNECSCFTPMFGTVVDKYLRWIAENDMTLQFLDEYGLMGTREAKKEQLEEFIAANYNKKTV